jgi:AcrR family transcriptional regulator
MARPRDPNITEALLDAAAELVAERGFAGVSMEAVAARAGVGKPAIYRRFSNKTALVVAAIARALPVPEAPGPSAANGDTRGVLRGLMDHGLPADGEGYVALIGGLMAEHRRHPELIEAFRTEILLPRRAIVAATVKAAQQRGDLRADLYPEAAIDLLAGPFLARIFAGLDVGPGWRDEMFERWWGIMRAEHH